MMKRSFLLLVLAAVVGALGAACQRSTTPPASPPAETAAGTQAPAVGQPPAATPPGTQLPGARPAPGSAASSGLRAPPAGTPVQPVPVVLPAVVATVNGENVPRWELETALKQAEANAGGP